MQLIREGSAGVGIFTQTVAHHPVDSVVGLKPQHIAQIIMFAVPDPVSYTHLRAVLLHPGLGQVAELSGRYDLYPTHPDTVPTGRPVSYTHLDVYKRQP